MKNFDLLLKKYAKLIVKTGINLQLKQVVLISCDIDAKDFCHLLVEECYKNGAREVIVNYVDQENTKLKLQYETIEQIKKIRQFDIDKLSIPVLQDNCCRIKILSEIIGVFENVDVEKNKVYTSTLSKLLKKVSAKVMNNDIQWCVVSYPNVKWAKKLFPKLSDDKAFEKLMEVILKTARVDEKNDSIKTWKKHIDEFYLVFKNGKIVDFKAKKNNELLTKIINSDAGTRSIGEIALVPFSSPINQTGILFYETLFDENASCHMAFGACYPGTIKGGEQMKEEQISKLGGNISDFHIDFMFGSKDMKIVGNSYSGKKITVFENGEFKI